MQQKITNKALKQLLLDKVIPGNEIKQVDFKQADRQKLADYILSNFDGAGEALAKKFLRFSANFDKMDWPDLIAHKGYTKIRHYQIANILTSKGFDLDDLNKLHGNEGRPGARKVTEAVDEKHTELLENAKKYIRVRTDFYKKSFIPNAKRDKVPALLYWKKGTIIEDYGRPIIEHIEKYDSFVNIPDNTDNFQHEYEFDGNLYYNLYEQPKYHPEPGRVDVTLNFLNHVFQDKVEVAIDYLKLLYEQPVQKLPVICLVSKEQATGKTTFMKWVCEIFSGNGIILGNEDFAGKFNTHYAGKLIIGIDESFIDKTLIKEKIKRLVTDTSINMEAKGRDVIKVDFIGKFILNSNKETNFIQMDDEDNRFFVCKVPKVTKNDQQIEQKLVSEIPAFLHYLKQHILKFEQKSRLWFDPKVYETEALKKIVVMTRSKVEKEILSWMDSIFNASESIEVIQIIPRRLASYLKDNLKSINGVPIEIERVLKEDWGLLPGKNQKFKHPFLKDMWNDEEKMIESILSYTKETGKAYSIQRTFIESKIGNF